MALTFKCASCGGMLQTADELAGKRVRCSHCKTVVQVPDATSPGTPPEAVVTEARPAASPQPPREPARPRRDDAKDRPRPRPEVKKSSSGGTLVLILALVGLFGLGSSCLGTAAVGWLLWDVGPQTSPGKVTPHAKVEVGENPRPEVEKVDPNPWPKDGPDPARRFKEPGEKAPPPPPKPDPPVAVQFDNQGAAEVKGAIDPNRKDPQFGPCKRYVFDARADTAYMVEVVNTQGLVVRVEPDGAPVIEPRPNAARNQLAFLADKGGRHVVLVYGNVFGAQAPFTLRVRAWDESQPLPDPLKLTPPPAVIPKVEVAVQVPNQLLTGGAFSPDNKYFWTAGNEFLTRWDHATLKPRGGFKTNAAKKWFHSLAVDGKGRLYAQVMPPNPAIVTAARPVVGPIEIYEDLRPKTDGDDLPTPRLIELRGIVRRMVSAPEGRWVYFLDTHNRKLGRINGTTGALDGTLDDISPGTVSFCLTPGGKKLYCCSSTGRIDVIDAAAFKVEKTITVAGCQFQDIAATDRGLLFLLGGHPQGFGGNCMMVDLSQKVGDRATLMPVACGYFANVLQMGPDQKVVFFSGDRRVTACPVPSRPGLFYTAGRDYGVRDFFTPGWIQISPDGRTILHDLGSILSVSR